MTVLAQPRLVNFNGLAAQVGFAGPNRLAITSADALAARSGSGGGGAGGSIDIRITMSPEVRAEVVSSSIKGARVQLLQDVIDDTPTSRAIRQKVG
jgi:hypothetical protein